MAEPPKKLEDTPKEALEAYLHYMWFGYYKWYEAAVSRCQWLWLVTQTVAIVAGFGAAVLAALSNQTWFQDSSLWRIALIVLPLVGTLAGSIAATSRVAARWALREQGRQAVQQLVDSGRQQYACAMPKRDTQVILPFEALLAIVVAVMDKLHNPASPGAGGVALFSVLREQW